MAHNVFNGLILFSLGFISVTFLAIFYKLNSIWLEISKQTILKEKEINILLSVDQYEKVSLNRKRD